MRSLCIVCDCPILYQVTAYRMPKPHTVCGDRIQYAVTAYRMRVTILYQVAAYRMHFLRASHLHTICSYRIQYAVAAHHAQTHFSLGCFESSAARYAICQAANASLSASSLGQNLDAKSIRPIWISSKTIGTSMSGVETGNKRHSSSVNGRRVVSVRYA